jgi:RecJ-like exonuclease
MMRKLDRLISEARKAAVAIRNFHGIVRIVSHYDADGISAASVVALALSREGKPFRLSVIKRLSEGKVKELAGEKNLLTIFADLGSGHLKSIQEQLLFPGAKVLILDHHQAKGEVVQDNYEKVIHANPMIFGINENLSAAGVAYFLAKELDPENIDLSYLGVVGAVGDSQMGSIEEKWSLSGPNREILKDAKKSGKLSVGHGLRIWGRHSRPLHKALEFCTDPYIPEISGSESASVQFLTELGIPLKKPRPELKVNEELKKEGVADTFKPSSTSFQEEWRTLSDLTEEETKTLATGIIKERIRGNKKSPHAIFGDVYEIPGHPPEFRSAEEFATILNACGKLGKPYMGMAMCMASPQSFEEARSLILDYRKDIGKAISWLNRSADAIKTTERGTYMLAGDRISEDIISNVVSIFSKSFLPKDRPVFAFADAEEGMVKVSARAHDMLVENGLDIQKVISDAALRFGGEGGGHRGAAGATIPKGSLEPFISLIEDMLSSFRKASEENDGLEQLNKAVFPESNINTNVPEEEHSERRDDYGTAETERGQGEDGGQRGEGDGGKATGVAFKQGTSPGSPERRERPEKMEGQGLVRYFSAKDVQ